MGNKTNLRAEQIKKLLISAQSDTSPEDQLVNDIVKGEVKLLSAKDICERLGLSENEFTELVRQNEPSYQARKKTKVEEVLGQMKGLEKVSQVIKSQHFEYQYSFPAPDIYIAGKARWTEDSLKNWLLQGAK